eukprot:gene10870-13316_t
MIEMKSVSKWYGTTQVLNDCSVKINKGEVVVVCGPSGSGKSTLIKTINALEPIQKGEIWIDGVAVHDKATDLPKLRSRVGMVFQHFELFPHLSVTDNLIIAQIKVLGRRRDEAKKRGLQMLERVLDVMVGLASEGMTMMVVTHEMGFARKVSNRVIFMDVGGRILEDTTKDEFFGKIEDRQPRTREFLNKILQY